MSDLDVHMREFHNIIKELFFQMNKKDAQSFLDRFMEKFNEQKCTQENSGSSR